MTTAKRRLAMLVAVSAVSGVMTLFAPATTSPAQAVPHDECVVLGTATLSSGFYYPVGINSPGPAPAISSAHSATFVFGGGLCAPSLAVPSATGTVHGWCGLSFGSGTTPAPFNDAFHWIGVGGTLFVTGEISGVVNAAPDPLIMNNSCTSHTPGAKDFLVNGDVVRHSCTVLNSPSHSVPRGASASVSVANLGHAQVHVQPAHIHAHIQTPVTTVSASAFHNDFHVGISVCA